MTSQDKVLIDRLRARFKDNFKITNLYALLLDKCPELIKPEMISTLTDGGAMTEKEAIVAILTEAFSLDIENTADRIFIREYIEPSVRILNPKKYTENPYYKNIKVSGAVIGNWELREEVYPAYRAVICDDMTLGDDFIEIPPLGFFPSDFHFPAVLEDGNEWMTLTPVDLDTSDEAIEAAHGKVVTFGLGLGYYTYMCSEKEEVDKIVVVEKSADVIKLFREHILPQFSHPEKVEIVMDDAFRYAEEVMPCENFDLAFVDTWRDASDGAPMYKKMRKLEYLSPNTKFLYWIENFLKSRIRAMRYETSEFVNFDSYKDLVAFIEGGV